MRSDMRGSILLAAVVLVGCKGDRPPPPPPASDVATASSVPKKPEPRFGEDGALLESDRVIAGLAMPRGLEPVFEEEGRHTFTGRLPVRKVLDYFGRRLITGDVTPIGLGAAYKNATPRDVRGGAVPLHVTVLSVPSGVRVEVQELKAIVAPPRDPVAVEKMVREHLSQLD